MDPDSLERLRKQIEESFRQARQLPPDKCPRLQFSTDGQTWHDLEGVEVGQPFQADPPVAGASLKTYLARLDPETPDADRLLRAVLGEPPA
jgi:hypothetical protein